MSNQQPQTAAQLQAQLRDASALTHSLSINGDLSVDQSGPIILALAQADRFLEAIRADLTRYLILEDPDAGDRLAALFTIGPDGPALAWLEAYDAVHDAPCGQ